MKKIIPFIIGLTIAFGITVGETQAQNEKAVGQVEKPTVAEFMAFKVYHHMMYMVTTAGQVEGTNKLLHTRKMPTEGTDPVVTPALDHIYTKAVIDLTEGPVIVKMPKVTDGRYYSIHITDQEHYTIYEEIHPVGKYAFVRKGKNMAVPDGAKVIESPSDYPHLFIRVQVRTPEDLKNVYPIQEKITLTGISKELTIENPISHTIKTHDVYPQNKEFLASAVNFSKEDYLRVMSYIIENGPRLSGSGNIGRFGPIDSREPGSNDPEIRASAIVGHLGLPVKHAYYAVYFANCNDEVFNGDKTEVFTFPYEPKGVELFWSVTRYSALTRNTLPGANDLFNAYNTKPDANGNITVTFSVSDPKDSTYWMPVNAHEPYYFVVRYYKPDVNQLPQKPCEE